jgi:5-methylthioadenosine/S-adenosylhomocysteine deaminase
VYAAGREQVSHVWVNGRCLMRQRQLLTLELPALLDKANWWQSRIVSQRTKRRIASVQN